jgi:DeoR/GlpR family transcriptional regulator of sugar metabolism
MTEDEPVLEDSVLEGSKPHVSGAAAGPRVRRERIRSRVVADGFVRAEDLAEGFSVSLMTVHRDLDALQAQGWLRKVRGGATAQPSALYHGDIRHRMQDTFEAKRELSDAAFKLVKAGESIILDDSTTNLPLAQRLPERGPLTVITNFLAVVKLLAGEPGIDLFTLGGAYFPAYDAFLGMHTREAVRALHADLLIMSSTAVTGGYTYNQGQETVAIERAMFDASEHRVLLLDHTKFGKKGMYQLLAVASFDLVLVDSATAQADIASLRAGGANVAVAAAFNPETTADRFGSEVSQFRRAATADLDRSCSSARAVEEPR